jgi:hypothetical protein
MTLAPTQHGTMDFFKDIAKYFMDFLETDFHKRRLPKRTVKYRNKDNLLIGVHLKKYETFNPKIRTFISQGFPDESEIVVNEGQYKTKLPKNIYELVKLQIENITKKDLSRLIEVLSIKIESNRSLHFDSLDNAILSTRDDADKIYFEEIVHPFITSIEKPLENSNLGNADDLYLIELEICSQAYVKFNKKNNIVSSFSKISY